MFAKNLRFAWRHISGGKFYSLLNIIGLSVGMAVSFLLLIYVFFEFNFDRYNTNSDRLFLAFKNQPRNGVLVTKPFTPDALANALQRDFPEVQSTARVNLMENSLVNQTGKPEGIKVTSIAADSSLLDMFTFDFLRGDKSRALSGESGIILTESLSRALFGDVDVVNRTLYFNSKYPLTVTAVIKDLPANSSLSFRAIISWGAYVFQQPWMKEIGWWNFKYSTYVMLKPGAGSIERVNGKIKGLAEKNDPAGNKGISLFLYPLTKLHLYNEFENGVSKGGRIDYVRLFFFLAIGILVIACINFMNLSTARSEKRAKEVGVLKVVGAGRANLVGQFMLESMVMVILSFVLSIGLLIVLLPYLNQITDNQLRIPFQDINAWLCALGICLLTGLLAGSYPAIFLSSFNPIVVLKGKLIGIGSAIKPRQVLVIVQFTFAIALIIGSIYIYRQIDYIRNRPIGYDANGVIELPVDGKLTTDFDVFKKDAIRAGAITHAATTSASITSVLSSTWGVVWPNQLPEEKQLPIDCIGVSYDFINTYGLQLVQGRDFEVGRPADSAGVLLNEAAVKLTRMKDPLGQEITWMNGKRTVVGVVRDFVLASPYEQVKPVIIGFMKDWVGNAALKLPPNRSISQNLGILNGIYKNYNPAYPFQYKFVDESFAKKFVNEKLLGAISLNFTFLAIFISCLGLFGLSSSSAERRRKELGIRKVLGASTGSLLFNLTREYLKLVIIAFAIGSSVSWYFVYKWLKGYAFHISFNFWIFLGAMLLCIFICLLAISVQAIKAATVSPVKSLRTE